MRAFLQAYRREASVAGLVIASLLGLGLPEDVSARMRGAVGTAFVPAQLGLSRAAGFLDDLVRPIVASWRRGRAMEALEAEMASLRAENAQLLQRLTERTRELDDLAALRRTLPAADLTFIVAPVIGRDSSTWSSAVTVSRGWRSGVKPGQLVVTPTERLIAAGSGDEVAAGDMVLDGARVVGRVTAVGPFHSVVRLVTDPASAMRAQVVGRREGGAVRTASGILQGSSVGHIRLTLEFIDRRNDIRPGDLVMTAGYGGILPEPLLVGRVEEVTASTTPLLSRVTVTPETDFDALRRVIIVHERPRLSATATEGGPP